MTVVKNNEEIFIVSPLDYKLSNEEVNEQLKDQGSSLEFAPDSLAILAVDAICDSISELAKSQGLSKISIGNVATIPLTSVLYLQDEIEKHGKDNVENISHVATKMILNTSASTVAGMTAYGIGIVLFPATMVPAVTASVISSGALGYYFDHFINDDGKFAYDYVRDMINEMGGFKTIYNNALDSLNNKVLEMAELEYGTNFDFNSKNDTCAVDIKQIEQLQEELKEQLAKENSNNVKENCSNQNDNGSTGSCPVTSNDFKTESLNNFVNEFNSLTSPNPNHSHVFETYSKPSVTSSYSSSNNFWSNDSDHSKGGSDSSSCSDYSCSSFSNDWSWL